jgi:hypothetical protein
MAILIVFFQHGKELRYNNFMDVGLLNIEVEKVLKIYQNIIQSIGNTKFLTTMIENMGMDMVP